MHSDLLQFGPTASVEKSRVSSPCPGSAAESRDDVVVVVVAMLEYLQDGVCPNYSGHGHDRKKGRGIQLW